MPPPIPAEQSHKLQKLLVSCTGMDYQSICPNWFVFLGGAISQAKGALSSWWSTFHQQPAEAAEEAQEALGPNGMRMSDIDLTE